MKQYFKAHNIIMTVAALYLIAQVTNVSASIIVYEGFGGSGGTIVGTSADAFSANVIAFGGNPIWGGSAVFKDDGTVTNTLGNRCASLKLGSYIEEHKGAADGKFALTMTILEVAGSDTIDILAFGFSNVATNDTIHWDGDFVTKGGIATIGYRADGELDMWAGVGVDNIVDGPDGNSGARTLTVTLDLTPAGGYDGTSNFGTVTWSDSVLGELGNHTYTSDIEFNWILLSSRSSASGAISALSLEKVDDQSSLTLNILPSGDTYIRNDIPNEIYDSAELISGRVSANKWIRSLLAFDLTVIPDNAIINGVTLDLYIDHRDSTSASGWVGSEGITLNELIQDASLPANHTWNEYNNSENLQWSTAGGDFSATVLSSIVDASIAPTNPDSVNAGDNFRFESSDDFVSAIESNRVDNMVQFVLRTPTIESSYNTRKLYRFASQSNSNPTYIPVLTVDYSFPQPLKGTIILIQ